MRFECYSRWDQLSDGADQLFEHCSKASMFFSREWFETLYAATFEEGQSLLLVCVVDDGRVLALLPLVGEGAHRKSFSHRYTALYSLLLAEEKRAEVLACLREGLLQIPVNSLELSPVAEDDDDLFALRKVLESAGYDYHHYFFFYNWIHRTEQQPFEQYLAQRPARLRNTIKRKQRKLAREHDVEIRMFRRDEVQQGLIDYHAAYSASWKAHEQYVALLDTLAINLSVPDWTRLAILYIDGQAAAAQLWFVVKGKASIFRLAYDEEWKRYSPGSILTSYLMEYVIDTDKVDEIDFLTGNEAYKQDWMSARRQRLRALLVRRDQSHDLVGSYCARLKRIMVRLFKKQAG